MKARVTSLEVDRVEAVLRHHVGAAFVISREALSAETGLSDRRVRQAIHELIVERGLPICSSRTGGYFLAASHQELEDAVRFIESYRDEQAQRARCLREAFATFEAEQLKLVADDEWLAERVYGDPSLWRNLYR